MPLLFRRGPLAAPRAEPPLVVADPPGDGLMMAPATPRGQPDRPVQLPPPDAQDGGPLGDRLEEIRVPAEAAGVVPGGRSDGIIEERSEAADEKIKAIETSSRAGAGVRAPRILRALHRRGNWVQLVKFGFVGVSGYVVNLAAYALLLKKAGFHYAAAATGSFLVAASWNYWWNRTWTFRDQRGNFGIQGMRFFMRAALWE